MLACVMQVVLPALAGESADADLIAYRLLAQRHDATSPVDLAAKVEVSLERARTYAARWKALAKALHADEIHERVDEGWRKYRVAVSRSARMAIRLAALEKVAAAAVEIAVDSALGEVRRQGGADYVLTEARADGIAAGRLALSASVAHERESVDAARRLPEPQDAGATKGDVASDVASHGVGGEVHSDPIDRADETRKENRQAPPDPQPAAGVSQSCFLHGNVWCTCGSRPWEPAVVEVPALPIDVADEAAVEALIREKTSGVECGHRPGSVRCGARFYKRLVRRMHLEPETKPQLDARLNKDEASFFAEQKQ